MHTEHIIGIHNEKPCLSMAMKSRQKTLCPYIHITHMIFYTFNTYVPIHLVSCFNTYTQYTQHMKALLTSVILYLELHFSSVTSRRTEVCSRFKLPYIVDSQSKYVRRNPF
jgi:hypothetical protein